MNTTPKPSATKKSNGELVGDEPPSWSLSCVAVGAGAEVDVVGMVKKASAQPQSLNARVGMCICSGTLSEEVQMRSVFS